MLEYKIKSKAEAGPVKMTTLVIGEFEMTATRNSAADTLSVIVNCAKRGVISPEMRLVNGRFAISYDHAVIFPEYREKFGEIYRKCSEFCDMLESELMDILKSADAA